MRQLRLYCFYSVLSAACLFALANLASAQPIGPPKTIQDIVKERLDTLQKIYDLTVKAEKAGKAQVGAVHAAKLALLHAQLELAKSKEEYQKLQQDVLKEAESWEKTVQGLVKDGKATDIDVLQAHLDVLEARLSVEIGKQPPKTPAPGGK